MLFFRQSSYTIRYAFQKKSEELQSGRHFGQKSFASVSRLDKKLRENLEIAFKT